ncbi:hypothetical protein [Pseudonocardia xinjiangensis]|uniref:Uncharacterized protein n=1 Tax=Pseudonocardia xinjiangensis TaxID=75289 RepID=A0ABX1RJK8_9PSEU|nr:hypothetical protein [Pseudonocardia xinjiangensis]NMH80016.1 hypothetical protein [Pseudonocardia xinjiangensis]
MVVTAEDDGVSAHLIAEVDQLPFTAESLVINSREEWGPTRDAIVVGGPASAYIGDALMSGDPILGMTIADAAGGTSWTS